MANRDIRYASLFSGIGGFELGIQRADPTAKCMFASETDTYARQIYLKNFGVVPHGDITRINATDVPEHDLLVGGFPCQDVSVAGKQEGLCGARSRLFYDLVRVLRDKQPELVLLENVRGLLSSNRGWDFARVLLELEGAGYECEWQIFNSKNYGVPQNRERVFIIGHLRGGGTRKVFPIRDESGTVREAGRACVHSGTLSTRNQSGQAQWDGSTTLISIAIDANYGKGMDNHGQRTVILSDSGVGRKTQLQRELFPPLRANTGAGHNNTVCTTGGASSTESLRRLTPLECERLQGFPDRWTELGIDDVGGAVTISDTQRYKCIGNAVTVNVVEFIVTHIFGMMRHA